MPPSSKTSKLGAKYGAKANQAVQSHADDETTYGFIELPAGITNGIAQLQQAYFEQYKEGDNKGEYYLRMSGVVLEPTAPVPTKTGPMMVAGLTTSIMVPVCETNYGGKKVTMEDNIARILLEFRRLGGPEFTSGATIDDLEDLASQLEEMAPYFKFTTQARIAQKDVPEKNIKKGDVLDGCFQNWHGTLGLEDYEPPTAKSATKVSGGAAAATPKKEEAKTLASSNGTPKSNGKPAPKEKESEEVEETNEVENEEGDENAADDLDALAADAADANSETSEDSGNRLIELAVESGIDEDWARKEAQSWEEVVEAIREKQEGGDELDENDEGDENQEEDTTPKVGDIVGYRPIDPKTKKQVKNPVKCEVTKVNTRTETVDLKAGKAAYKDIEWSELESLEEVA